MYLSDSGFSASCSSLDVTLERRIIRPFSVRELTYPAPCKANMGTRNTRNNSSTRNTLPKTSNARCYMETSFYISGSVTHLFKSYQTMHRELLNPLKTCGSSSGDPSSPSLASLPLCHPFYGFPAKLGLGIAVGHCRGRGGRERGRSGGVFQTLYLPSPKWLARLGGHPGHVRGSQPESQYMVIRQLIAGGGYGGGGGRGRQGRGEEGRREEGRLEGGGREEFRGEESRGEEFKWSENQREEEMGKEGRGTGMSAHLVEMYFDNLLDIIKDAVQSL